MFVSVVHLGVPLSFRDEKANFFQALQFSLDIASIFFNELGQPPDMCLEVRVLSVDNNYFASHPRCNKYV